MTADPSTHFTQLMEETVAFALDHVHNGGIPFAAFIVDRNGVILGRGVNCVRKHHDPTAHAEVEAIRDACHAHSITQLAGATLLASGEPCAMCYMNAVYAGITTIYFAANREEAALNGFDYRSGYALYEMDPTHWSSLQARKLPVLEGLRPFQLFQERGTR